MSSNHEVLPVSRAGYLDGWWRQLTYQPGRLVHRYARWGDFPVTYGTFW